MGSIADEAKKPGSLTSLWQRHWALLFVMGLVLGLDQLTKSLVRASLDIRESVPSDWPIRLTHTYNTGSAFGLFQDQTMPLILASLVAIGILLLVYRNYSFPGILLRLSLGLQLGGASGNLLDRVRIGHVTDFIDVGAWPIFNLADSSIVAGILLLALLLLRSKKEEPVPPTGGATETPRSFMATPYPICPLCSSPLVETSDGRRCPSCGARDLAESSADPFAETWP